MYVSFKDDYLNIFICLIDIFRISGYFAIQKVFDPAPGETVVISTAAGATGSVAGQVAKIRGMFYKHNFSLIFAWTRF